MSYRVHVSDMFLIKVDGSKADRPETQEGFAYVRYHRDPWRAMAELQTLQWARNWCGVDTNEVELSTVYRTLISPRVEGVSVSLNNTMTPEIVYTHLGRQLNQLHLQTDWDGAGIVHIGADGGLCGSCSRWTEYLANKWPEHVTYLDQNGLIESARFSDLPAMLPIEQWSSLLHGDLNDSNLIYNAETDTLTLIDWEDALIGDPLFDLANWACFHDQHKEWWPILFNVYGRPDAAESRAFWFYYLRHAMARLILHHRNGVEDLTRGRERVLDALSHLT